ncbi:type IV secretory system conjugative DNA transfer family protein, partial [Acinetobacter baumannii]
NEVVVSIAKDITRTAKNDNLLSSIMTSLSKAFAFLDDDRIRTSTAKSDVALKEVLLKPKQAVFLQFDQQYKSTTETLFGAMVAHTLRILQSSYRKRGEVFVA